MSETVFASLRLEHCADDIAWQHRRGGMNRGFDRWLRDWRKLGPNKTFTGVTRVNLDGSRETLQGVPDYTGANRKGSRGVYYWYTLAPGLYDINHRYKINAVRRYWLLSESGTTREMTTEEANLWQTMQSTNAI